MGALTDRQRQVLDAIIREAMSEFGYREDTISQNVNLGVLIDTNDFPIPMTQKNLAGDNVITPMFSVDFTKVPDRSFSSKILFSVEVRDATNTQIRSGDLNANVCVTSGGTYATSQADQSTSAITSGSLTVTFSWTTNGNIATFNVTPNSSLVPVGMTITYCMIHASHSGAATPIP